MNIELFSASGGMAEGFRRAGIHFDHVFDYAEEAVASYEYNLGHKPIRMDVRDLLRLAEGGWRPGPQRMTNAETGEYVELDDGTIDFFCADPPCTPYSRAGKRLGPADERDMLEATCRLIALLKPRAALIGNVPGLQDATSWPVVQRYIGGLVRHGYCVADYAQLDAACWGVPQHRIRPFWFLHLDGPCVTWPLPTHGDVDPRQVQMPGTELLPYVTCRDALQHLALAELGRPVRVRTAKNRGGGGWDDHPTSKPNRPAQTQTANGGRAGKRASVLLANDRHPAAAADAPAPTVGAKDRGQSTVLRVTSDKHPSVDDAAPSTTIRGGGDGHSAPEERAPNPNQPPADPDAPHRTVTAAGRGEQALLEWPWNRPATTVFADPRVAPPGHHPIEGSFLSGPNAVVLSERAAGILQNFPDGCEHEYAYWADRSVDAWEAKRQRWLASPASQEPVLSAEPTRAEEKAHKAWQRKTKKFAADAPRDPSWFSADVEPPPRFCEECGAQRRWRFIADTKSARWSLLGMGMPPGLAEAVARSIKAQRDAAAQEASEAAHARNEPVRPQLRADEDEAKWGTPPFPGWDDDAEEASE